MLPPPLVTNTPVSSVFCLGSELVEHFSLLSVLIDLRFFKEICEKSNSDTIEFSADGSWRPFSNKGKLLCAVCAVKNSIVDQLFSLSLSLSLSHTHTHTHTVTPLSVLTPDTRQKEGPITIHNTPEKGGGAGTSSDPIVIDLTLSDSEDEDPVGNMQSS